MNSNRIDYLGSAFVLPAQDNREELGLGGRGMPSRAALQTTAQEINSAQTLMLDELSKRLAVIESALAQREAVVAKGMNAFAEKVGAMLVETWGRALENQEKQLLAEISSTLWRIFEEQEAERRKNWERQLQSLLEHPALPRGKNESERPASWWSRIFENKDQT